MSEAGFLKLDARVARIEQTLHGPTGANGLYSEVKALRRELREYIEAEEKRRDTEAEQVLAAEAEKRKGRRTTLLALMSALIAAIAVILPYISGPV